MRRNAWSILLAGGEGSRLREVSRDPGGGHRPKQFCSFGPGPTLLRRALNRSAALVPRTHIMPVVNEAHQQWWEHELKSLVPENIAVQPGNRGTAPAVLLPLLMILDRDPEARVVIIPSDHFVEREEILHCSLFRALEASGERLILLGVRPQSPEAELGWISPLEVADSDVMRVGAFVEKPDRTTAARLMREGALVNTMILVGQGSALLDLYREIEPDMLRLLGGDLACPTPPSAGRLREVYAQASSLDFSRHLLEVAALGGQLWVTPIPACGWSDLGTRERLEKAQSRHGWEACTLQNAVESAPRGLGSDYWLG